MDAAGEIFIADTGNDRIREVNHATSVITTVAGNAGPGYSGDNGPATAAELVVALRCRGGRRREPLLSPIPTTTGSARSPAARLR